MKSTAFCYKHGAECPLRTACAGMRGDVSGTSCTDESSMGLRRSFKGKTSLSFAVWLTEIKWFYDFSVQEITSLFDSSIFERLLPEFSYTSKILSPSQFGLPYSRPRKFTILLRRAKWQLSRSLDESGPQAFRCLRGPIMIS